MPITHAYPSAIRSVLCTRSNLYVSTYCMYPRTCTIVSMQVRLAVHMHVRICTHTHNDRQADRQTHCHVCVHKCVSDRHTLPPISAQYMPPPHPAPSTVPGTRVCGFICQVAEEIILEHTVVAKSKHTRVGTCLRNRMRPCAGASVGKSSTEHDLYRYVAR